MSSIMKSKDADKKVFAFQPKPFRIEASQIAKDFVERENNKPSDFLVSEIVSEATKIRDIRKKDSEALIEESVLVRMKEIEEEAYAKAYELGLIEGEKKAFEVKSEEIRANLASLEQTIETFSSLKSQLYQQNEAFFIKLLYQMASRIALKEIAESPEPLAEFLKQIVDGVEGDDRVLVHLAEQDFAFLKDLQAKQGSESSFNRVKLAPSATIQPGGCVIESNFGTIDATVEKRVEKVWSALEAKLPHLKGHHTGLVAEEVAVQAAPAEAAPAAAATDASATDTDKKDDKKDENS